MFERSEEGQEGMKTSTDRFFSLSKEEKKEGEIFPPPADVFNNSFAGYIETETESLCGMPHIFVSQSPPEKEKQLKN